ncbi:hypothetical protein V5O48_016934 [Marasmius crinis-equi]|uniref:DNA 3'-5' helicase n=1 Tax=Marasmius crinis-equi TaxID=585013 RepID=A0ABR3EQD3_9AGAR
MADICDYICTLHRRRGKPSTGIIYCRTRATCNDLSAYLRGKGLSVKPYHKGIAPATLDKTLAEWTKPGGSEEGGIDAVVATIAFGLGIDKGDVRYIIHYDLPKSFEGYYQETGRAGRNGTLAKCVLYYSREDVIQVRRWVSDSHIKRLETARPNDPPPSQRSLASLSELVRFAEGTSVCRHISICRYFGETINANDPEVVKSYCNMMCDVCKYPDRTRKRKGVLSSEEYASSQASSTSYRIEDDENDPADAQRAAGKTGWGNISRSTSLSNVNTNTASRAISNISSKRPAADSLSKPGSDSKKTKVDFAPPLVTKPFNSASNLRKPFKSPFIKAPLEKSTIVNNAEPLPEPQMTSDFPRATTSTTDTGSSEPRASKLDVSPVDNGELEHLNAIKIELEDGGSTKIPIDSRRKGVDSLRIAIHTLFSRYPSVWAWFESSKPRDTKKAAEFFAQVARDLEYLALTFSSTAEGYEERIKIKMRAANELAEIVEAGKDPTANEDVSEVVQCVKDVL